MSGERKAKLFQNGGSQAVRLPADVRFDGEEVYITRDDASGDVILSAKPRRNVWKDFIAFRDSLDIPREDLDTYTFERPMNQPVSRRSVSENEDEDCIMPPNGVKPRGNPNPPKPQSGRMVSDAVIEDRR